MTVTIPEFLEQNALLKTVDSLSYAKYVNHKPMTKNRVQINSREAFRGFYFFLYLLGGVINDFISKHAVKFSKTIHANTFDLVLLLHI
jgi:hypothetical protein